MTRALGTAAVASCLLLSACSRPLPEEGTPQANLYAFRCGGCHPVYQPRTLTAAMWKIQIDRMDKKFTPTGVPMPDAAEREQILEYLTRHAGG